MFCSPDDRYVNPGGEWVRFTDVQARLERLARFEQAEAELLAGWERAGLPPEPPVPNGDEEYVWSFRERLSYLLYLSDPSVAVAERTKELEARIKELETQLVDTERRRVAAVEQAEQLRAGIWQMIRSIDRLRDSVAAYRSTGESTPAPDETGGK